MSAPGLLTKLDAVNSILSLVGEAPLNTLDGVTSIDAIQAINEIERATRDILTSSFWFNTEEVTLTPVSGEYKLPDRYMSVTVCNESDNFVQRGARLFNQTSNSYTGHTKDIDVVAHVALDWDELPQSAREVIQADAASSYGFSQVGEGQLYRVSQLNLSRALMVLHNENLAQLNMSRLNGPALRGGFRRWR